MKELTEHEAVTFLDRRRFDLTTEQMVLAQHLLRSMGFTWADGSTSIKYQYALCITTHFSDDGNRMYYGTTRENHTCAVSTLAKELFDIKIID